ncbi:Uma2 family endonuclease [Spirulina sp. 06S082]|uniref:Uma2 family endonuclease n=1 Tax=Spirulina sp. 06S082 TaxID=3110248 RepID=UPI002B1EE523|nr:Uma2 family endonuclease [Spirulina sp. 06S082]MEA5470471.1 Uma2 family endonuclease [Spirulina sp. 06S082]
MVAAIKTRYYTPEEYLALEEQAEFKNEYRDGEIVPMTGGTTNHNELAGNFYAYLKFFLKKKPYRVYMGDVKLWIPSYRQFTYPDIMVIQGKPIYTDKSKTTVMNPMLIVEVLSKSTQNYDRGDKFEYYRSIPEMKEYILIDQKRFYAMQYVKNDADQWVLSEYTGEESAIALNSLEFEITFSDLYEGVDFTEEEEGDRR